MSTESSAEAMAREFEADGGPEITGCQGKRPKAERADHKHQKHGEDTRKIVQNAQNGEAKRKENNLPK